MTPMTADTPLATRYARLATQLNDMRARHSLPDQLPPIPAEEPSRYAHLPLTERQSLLDRDLTVASTLQANRPRFEGILPKTESTKIRRRFRDFLKHLSWLTWKKKAPPETTPVKRYRGEAPKLPLWRTPTKLIAPIALVLTAYLVVCGIIFNIQWLLRAIF